MPVFYFTFHRHQKMALTQEQRGRDKQEAVQPCSSNSSTNCLTPISGGPSVSPLSLVSTNQSSFQSESQQQRTKRPISVCSDASSYEEGDEFDTIYPYQLRKRRDLDEYSRLFQENVPSSVADRLMYVLLYHLCYSFQMLFIALNHHMHLKCYIYQDEKNYTRIALPNSRRGVHCPGT
ncbi:unnamed protein product [Rodentolepis nana]|uniref:Enhancer of polycomb homolog 1 n=1 Tax=Rodentolepis nana TaxID=102285 RepID=A0A0R3TD03_RODNA|nr:unnamed protein product [Rodentolepis nana]